MTGMQRDPNSHLSHICWHRRLTFSFSFCPKPPSHLQSSLPCQPCPLLAILSSGLGGSWLSKGNQTVPVKDS